MENTEFRLNESKFFLERMKDSKDKSPEFEYHLNAYISSSRSVIWIMNSEYSKVNGWKKWYEDKGVSEEQKKLLDGIVKMRNRSVKQKPLKVTTYITIGDDKNFCDINDVARRFVGKKVSIEIMEEKRDGFNFYEDKNRVEVSGELKISTTVEEFKNKDIFDICIEYDAWLSIIVNECVSIFG